MLHSVLTFTFTTLRHRRPLNNQDTDNLKKHDCLWRLGLRTVKTAETVRLSCFMQTNY